MSNQKMILINIMAVFTLYGCSGKDLNKYITKKKGNLNITQHKLNSDTFKYNISFDFKHTLNKCFMSDHDLLQIDKKKFKVKNHIITLERIDKNEPPLFQSNVNINKFHSIEIEGPSFSRFSDLNGIYGLFICSDSSRKGSCKNKRSIEFNELLSKTLQGINIKEIKKDKIFWFKPVIISNDTLYVIHHLYRYFEDFKDLIKPFISNKTKTTKIIDFVRNTDNKLKNLNVKSEAGKLVIDIAKLDPTCDKNSILKLYTRPKKTSFKKLQEKVEKSHQKHLKNQSK